MSMTMTVSGADRSIRFDWPAASRAWAEAVEPAALSLMKSHAPVGAGTWGQGPGALRQSIGARTEPSPDRMWVVLFGDVPYLGFVLAGTAPHAIRVRNARALRWLPHRGHGSPRYAISVWHPGTKPDDFPERAISPMRNFILRSFTDAVQGATVIE